MTRIVKICLAATSQSSSLCTNPPRLCPLVPRLGKAANRVLVVYGASSSSHQVKASLPVIFIVSDFFILLLGFCTLCAHAVLGYPGGVCAALPLLAMYGAIGNFVADSCAMKGLQNLILRELGSILLPQMKTVFTVHVLSALPTST